MTALVVVTLVAAGALVLALAAYLVAVVVLLVQIRGAVGGILDGLRRLAGATAPLGSVLGDVRTNLVSARDAVREAMGHPEPPEGSYLEPRHRVRP